MLSLVGDLSVTVERRCDGVWVLTLRGDLGRHGARTLDRTLLDMLDRRPRLLIFDLSQVTSVRPDGLPVLLRLACTAGELGVGCCLVGADRAEVTDRLETAGWLDLFEVHPTVGDAVTSLG
ncbi:anti-anti-sigma factor [Amycolatopsis xylanica]|uniref:Anti-anti-sigma factor n=1 Tax=Amycolatopsis xylanica TaxID=589385 RepID=A0A1H3NG51_9PSEU|nr:STAS domain-containing protein [Amycolatopsis xylanica]SDY87640.1 anti-anti-sigma factor [Amycolatopsis xylanica]